MKKVLLTLCGSILLGCIFGFMYFKNTEENIVDALFIDNQVSAFQVGVYKSYSNALEESKKYESATVINDGDFYRVFIAMANDKDLIMKLESYYKSNNIYYYLKNIVLPDEFLTSFENYQKVLLSTDNIDIVNKNLLKEYSDSINGVYN